MAEAAPKLLVIDDDTIVRQSVVAYLEDSGFWVEQAADGAEGLSQYQNLQPDLVLTDLRMPGVDGLELLKGIHAHDPEVPVIVVSGAGVMGDVVEALRLGASDYMIKPVVDMEMLVHSVRKSLERRLLRRQNQRYRDELEVANRDLKEHLRTLERDQLAGRQVQQRLLPPTPVHKRAYTLEQRVLPSLYLSGDFIDYAYINERYLPFYLADVSGHGASSAFVTVWLKHLITRLVREQGLYSSESSFQSGTCDMLMRVNEALHKSRLNHHLTFFSGIIDCHTNTLRYSVAGHLPMPVLKTQDGAQFLEGKGKPVGIFKDVEWPVYECQLPDDFSLVCFSDGILEILPPDDLLAKESYLLEKLGKMPNNLDNLVTDLAIEQFEDLPDDIAILTVSKGKL